VRLAIVVPVKSYARAKQRLDGLLTEVERTRLATTMTQDVLATVTQLTEYGRFIVSDDDQVLDLGRRLGMEAVEDRARQGQSAAVRQGFDAAWAAGFAAALTIPGDVPGVTPDELRGLCESRPEFEVLLAPDRERQGTNGLRLKPPHAIALRFGEDSFRLHAAEAARAHRSFAIMDIVGLACDLDRQEDVVAFMQLGRETATLRLLRDLRVLDRVPQSAIPHG
jgi:2-phospho-L-lactate guanylyltransferase